MCKPSRNSEDADDTMSTSSPLNAESKPPINDAGSARPERRVAINSGLLLVAFSFQAAVSLVMVGF